MILIQCTKTKKDEPVPARELYEPSRYFRAMRDYAKATGDLWFILSAEHGLIDPDTVLEPYDAFGLSENQARDIAEEVATGPDNYVEVIGGKKYTNPLTPELEARGIEVVEVARGQRIGKRIETLKQKTRELQNKSLC